MFHHSARTCPQRTFLKSLNGAAGEQLRSRHVKVMPELMKVKKFIYFFAVDVAGVPPPVVMRTFSLDHHNCHKERRLIILHLSVKVNNL